MFIATYTSRHFTFQGAGDTAAQAIDVCQQGLREHARQCKLDPGWWCEGYAPPHDDLFIVRQVEAGTAYRDGEPL